MCKYLGIEGAPVTAGLRKVTPLQPRDALANFDQVRQAFAPTRYSPYLEGV